MVLHFRSPKGWRCVGALMPPFLKVVGPGGWVTWRCPLQLPSPLFSLSYSDSLMLSLPPSLADWDLSHPWL